MCPELRKDAIQTGCRAANENKQDWIREVTLINIRGPSSSPWSSSRSASGRPHSCGAGEVHRGRRGAGARIGGARFPLHARKEP